MNYLIKADEREKINKLKKEILSIPYDVRLEIRRLLHNRKNAFRARKDINIFANYVFGFTQAPLHRRWHSFADENDRAFIEAPQEHGKTTQMAVIRTLFKLGCDHERWFKIVACNDDKANDILFEITTNLENNENLHEVFPDLKPAEKGIWTKHKIIIDRKVKSQNPSVEALGILSSGSGKRATDLIFDDVVDFRNSILYPAMREQVISAYKDQWLGTLTKDGRIIYICNAWHSQDLTQEIKKPRYHFAHLTCKIDKDLTPLWPEEWPEKRLRRTLIERGEGTFNRAFRHIPFDSTSLLFADKLKTSFMPVDKEINFLEEFREKYIDPSWPKFAGADLAISKKKRASRTVLFEIAIDPEGNKWPAFIKRGLTSSPDTARAIRDLFVHDHFYLMFVENNAYQGSLLEWLQELDEIEHTNLSIPVEGYRTGSQKFDPFIGLPSLALQLSRGKWKIPQFNHSSNCKCEYCEWMRDLATFPKEKRTYDVLMAMWFADRASQQLAREPNIRLLGEDGEGIKEEAEKILSLHDGLLDINEKQEFYFLKNN